MRIKRKLLAALSKICDLENGRYAFGCVELRRDEQGRVTACATDGRRLVASTWTSDTTNDDGNGGKEWSATIAKMVCQSIVKMFPDRTKLNPCFNEVLIDETKPSLEVEVANDSGRVACAVSEDNRKFPNWVEVVAPKKDGVSATVNLELLTGLIRCFRESGMKHAVLTMNPSDTGEKSIRIFAKNDGVRMVGAIIPMEPGLSDEPLHET